MWSKSDIVNKQIVYRYSRSFDIAVPSIGLFKMTDDSSRMVVQQSYGFEPITDGLQLIQVITYEGVKSTHSKTMEYNASNFDRIFNDIVNSLLKLSQAEFPTGLDGDSLSVEIATRRGLSSTINIWGPGEDRDNQYHFNAVYAGFVEVLETAGLLDWYMKDNS